MAAQEIITQFQSDNEIQYIQIYGGLYGIFEGRSVDVINKRLKKLNANEWRVLTIYPEVSADLFTRITRSIILILTLFIFTWSDGYYVLSEKSKKKKEKEKLTESLFI